MSRLAAVLAAGFFTACTSVAELSPAPTAERVRGDGRAARTSAGGVTVVAAAHEWPGAVPIERAVTPLEVVVVNDSDMPVRVTFDRMALVDVRGRGHPALQPEGIQETVAIRPDPWSCDYAGRPSAFCDSYGFGSPYWRLPYSYLHPWGGPFFDDYGHYGSTTPSWRRVLLPTSAMVQLALPEGVIEPGGRAEGFVYFEKLDPEIPAVELRAIFTDPTTLDEIGRIRIPFVVRG